jgi:hypothetical protein
MDIEKHGDTEQKRHADKVLQFLTPICKAFMTDMGLEVTSLGIQIFGGHGYIREWGMEQLMRDTRIAQLYEGTNGIQALDLIGRKLTRDGGHMLNATYQAFGELVSAMGDSAQRAKAQDLLDDWHNASKECLGFSATHAAGAACDYLNYTSYSLLGVLWLSMAESAAKSDNQTLASAKQKVCDFYIARMLPRGDAHKAAYLNDSDGILSVSGAEFDYQ